MADSGPPLEDREACDADAHAVRRAAATALDEAADMLDAPRNAPDALRAALANLRTAMDGMELRATHRLPVHRPKPGTESEVRAFIETLDLSFRAQELGYATLQIMPATWTWPRPPSAAAGPSGCWARNPAR